MRLTSLPLLQLMAATLLLLSPRQAVNGFSVTACCNTTTTAIKTAVMMPLQVDRAFSLVNNDNAPRGIVLNGGVGGLTFAGGLMGFLKAGSKASLIAGSGFGGLLMASAVLISKNNSKGNILGSGVASLLSYAMGKKFIRSGKFMPAGLIASAGIVAVVYNLVEAIRPKEKADDTNQEVAPGKDDDKVE